MRRRFWGREVLNALVHLPLILPLVVTGYLLLMFWSPGFAGKPNDYFGITIAFNGRAQFWRSNYAFPLVVRAVRLSIEQVKTGFEHAALTLGARPITVFFTITLPMGYLYVVGAILVCQGIREFGQRLRLWAISQTKPKQSHQQYTDFADAG